MGNFLYTCVQMAHNLGAVAVVGVPAVAWLLLWINQAAHRPGSTEEGDSPAWTGMVQCWLPLLTIIAWSVQAVSGAAFGATSYYLKGHLPEVAGAAFAALGIKVGCAAAGFFLTAFYLWRGSRWSARMRLAAWQTLFALGFIALMAAAVLRWYA
ncbi:MAG: hypothetical protein HQK86_08195 [Nitrospinae bacterium]|nr:hypothetical protein [Nitrospinota bacterium]MBF0634132.1 hypothetical protein [Nitrospinota bacterium]